MQVLLGDQVEESQPEKAHFLSSEAVLQLDMRWTLWVVMTWVMSGSWRCSNIRSRKVTKKFWPQVANFFLNSLRYMHRNQK
jgi:hypothetical protein